MHLTNTITLTKSAATSEQLNAVMGDTIAYLEDQGYNITNVSEENRAIKSITIKKENGVTNISFNYFWTQNVLAEKEEL